MIYNIHHLHCGTFCPICAPLFGQQGWQAKLVCHCLLLETDQGLVLVDTGLGVEDYLHPKQRLGTLLTHTARIQHDLSQTSLKQIQQLGYQASDVQHILVSHLDFDHAGGIADFPNATVHIFASEYKAACYLKSLKNRMRYKPKQFQQHTHWDFLEPTRGEAWFNFNRVQGLTIFKDEILLIPLPGHSAGHCGIAIRQAQGWLFFCGDAYYAQAQLDPKQCFPALHTVEYLFAENNLMRLKTLANIQHLAQTAPQVEIICAHDPIALAQYQIPKA